MATLTRTISDPTTERGYRTYIAPRFVRQLEGWDMVIACVDPQERYNPEHTRAITPERWESFRSAVRTAMRANYQADARNVDRLRYAEHTRCAAGLTPHKWWYVYMGCTCTLCGETDIVFTWTD
mgnify:FL=1